MTVYERIATALGADLSARMYPNTGPRLRDHTAAPMLSGTLVTIADLCARGVELTGNEIDLLCETDARLWFLGDEVKREWREWTIDGGRE